MFVTVEQKIVERLKAAVPGVTVTTAAELARVQELRQKAPAVFVVYAGFVPGQEIKNVPTVQQIVIRFDVVVTTKNAAGAGVGTAARDDAGPLVQSVIEALIGLPVGGGKYLRLSDSGPAEYDAGYAYTPIGVECGQTLKAAP